ncbi:MAG: hypothetical protein ACD_61C00267G0001 [uncultured bacterium]|nr:MAG: hypothetical protein ACD_61C00267G0001 [uncultured bacterium]
MDTNKFRKWYDMVRPGSAGAAVYAALKQRSDAEADALLDQALMGNKSAEWLKAQLNSESPAQSAEPTYTPVIPLPAGSGSRPTRAERIRARGSQRTSSPDPKPARTSPFKGLFAKKPRGEAVEGVVVEEGKKPAGTGKKMLLVVVVALLLLALAVGAFFMFSGSGSAYPSFDTMYPTGESLTDPTGTPEISPTSIPVDPNQSESLSEKKDRSFWSELISKEVPELSPGNLNNQLSAKTAVGLILMVVLTLWSWGEGSIRRKSQQNAGYFGIRGLLAGWLTMPILVLVSKATLPGWIMVGVGFLIWLWAYAASTIKSQSDLTPFLTALGLFTATLFYYGKLTFITTLGTLFGATWASWTGVTTVLGVFTLLFTGRGIEALLTILIIILGITVIILASLEVGKKHGKGSAFFIALLILLVFGFSNWGLTAGVEYLVQVQNTSVLVTVVLNVLAPILAWVFSLLTAVGIGVAMGDTEVGRTENRQVLGLQKTGTFLQNIADFGILGTLIPLFFGVIIILF